MPRPRLDGERLAGRAIKLAMLCDVGSLRPGLSKVFSRFHKKMIFMHFILPDYYLTLYGTDARPHKFRFFGVGLPAES